MSALSDRLQQAKGERSIDAIADQAATRGHPVHRSVVAKYLAGVHGPRPPEATLRGLAEGLGLDVRELRQLARRPRGELGPYVPVDAAASLTQRQRDALDALIKAFVTEEGDTADGTNAEKSDERTLTVVPAVVDDDAMVNDDTAQAAETADPDEFLGDEDDSVGGDGDTP